MVSATIDPATGLRVVGDGLGGVTEYFYQENIPAENRSVVGDPLLNPNAGPNAVDDLPFPAEP